MLGARATRAWTSYELAAYRRIRRAVPKLPSAVQAQARKNYRLWRENPAHPSLHFKRIHGVEAMYSVRVGLGWRAVGLVEGDTIYWFWIGSHADYDKLLKQL